MCKGEKKNGIYVKAGEKGIVPLDPQPDAPPCPGCFQSWPDPSSEKSKLLLENYRKKGEEQHRKYVCRECNDGADIGEASLTLFLPNPI